MIIKKDDLTGTKIQALLAQHLNDAFDHSPADSVFALDLSGLQTPNITVWSVWDDREEILLGCGALKILDPKHGEIKSMRTTDAALRKGVGSFIINHIIDMARGLGMTRISLETGTNEPYMPARALYEKLGFEKCDNFDQYEWGGFSYLMSREI